MKLAELRELTAKHVPDGQPDGQPVVLPMDGLFIVRHMTPSPFQKLEIGPFAALILQGQKMARLDDRVIVISEGQTTVLGHDVPIEYCIAQGSADKPFMALVFQLDFDILRMLKGRIDALTNDDDKVTSLQCLDQDAALVSALDRYLKLANNQVEREILGPSILEEMHLRLLQSQNSGILRQLLSQDSHASKIAQSIVYIRDNLKDRISVEEVASNVGMGKSAFYDYFQQFTGKSPMSFTKMLRLQEARRMIVTSKKQVSAAAFEVGYASASQFSRDYKNHFGVSPSEDEA